jgi:hypothetical protein
MHGTFARGQLAFSGQLDRLQFVCLIRPSSDASKHYDPLILDFFEGISQGCHPARDLVVPNSNRGHRQALWNSSRKTKYDS